MKRPLLLTLNLFLLALVANAQFANDVIIQSNTVQNQRNARISAGFNGWLYSAYTTIDTTNNNGGITILRSQDHGVTWSTIDAYSVSGVEYQDVEIVATGNDSAGFVLFVAGLRYDAAGPTYIAFIDRYNYNGSFIGSSFNRNLGSRRIYDIAIASDYMNPAVSTSPFSVALLMSTYSASTDSITCHVSLDGGVTFTENQPVASTGSYFGKVSLSYGKSSSGSNGRYFAAWERRTSSTARTGNIYTSRHSSQVNGSWVTPVNLDSLSSSMIGLCRNPRISTSIEDSDNDSGSVTAVVLVDRDYNGDGSDYDILGFYNKRSHFTNYWYRLDVMNTGENDIHCDVVYDYGSDNFYATYQDTLGSKLVYVSNNLNLTTPGTWSTVSTSYNDDAIRTNAYPRLAYSPSDNGVGAVWIRSGVGTARGLAMFDATFSNFFVGLDENNQLSFEINAYPNPTTDYVYIQLTNIDMVNIYIMNANGQMVKTANNISNQHVLDMTDMAAGIYFVTAEFNNQRITKKIIKN